MAVVEVERRGRVGVVTLNRPEVLNAINPEMERAFREAMWELEADEAVRAIVVTGSGRAFCAGADLGQGADSFGEAARERHFATIGVTEEELVDQYAFWKMRTPVIAAINGVAVGAGMTIPLLMDIRLVAEDARLRFPFTRINMTPEANSTWILPRLIGVSRALELLLSGRFFTGREAAEMGLASRSLPADEVLPAALELAEDIASGTAPVSVAVTKDLVYRFLEVNDRRAAFEHEMSLTWWAGAQPDTAVAVDALLNGTEPEWTMSKHAPFPEPAVQA